MERSAEDIKARAREHDRDEVMEYGAEVVRRVTDNGLTYIEWMIKKAQSAAESEEWTRAMGWLETADHFAVSELERAAERGREFHRGKPAGAKASFTRQLEALAESDPNIGIRELCRKLGNAPDADPVIHEGRARTRKSVSNAWWRIASKKKASTEDAVRRWLYGS